MRRRGRCAQSEERQDQAVYRPSDVDHGPATTTNDDRCLPSSAYESVPFVHSGSMPSPVQRQWRTEVGSRDASTEMSRPKPRRDSNPRPSLREGMLFRLATRNPARALNRPPGERPDHSHGRGREQGATDESACTPGSVPGRSPGTGGGHPSRPAVAGRLQRPTRRHRAGRPRSPAQAGTRTHRPSWPCSGWGLPSHPGHPGCWWALTPPFHPYRRYGDRRRSVLCGTVPRVTPGCR
jgi:hypothetical protein